MADALPPPGPPSLGERLIELLKRAPGPEVVADHGTLRARATVRGAGPYGSEIDELTVERVEVGRGSGRGPHIRQIVERIAERVDYLGEPLDALEVAPTLGRGQLRTRRDRVRDREYYEVDVWDGGRVRVARVRAAPGDGDRTLVPQNHGHGVLRRLVDDLGDLLSSSDADDR